MISSSVTSLSNDSNLPDANLPEKVDLDGRPALLRRMTADDREAMLRFARALPEEDLLFLRTDITREHVVDLWIRELKNRQTQTVVAVEQGSSDGAERILGYSSLHLSESLWTRHLGEILLLVTSDGRGHGLGGRLARQILELAKRHDLQKLVAQMTSTQRSAQALFHSLGFIPEAMLHDWVIDREGRTHNLIMMSREVDLDEEFLPAEPNGDD